MKAPPDAFPEPLIQALQLDDADAFTKAFAVWLDSGVMRDREIRYAANLNREIIDGSNLGGAIGQSGPYLPPAPRLRPDVLLNTNIPATDRMKAIALLAQLLHNNRFAKERADAVALLGSKAADKEMLRRAAFWELRDANPPTPGLISLNRLAGSDDADTQRFLLGLCFGQPMDDDMLHTIRIEIKAGRQTFINGLFDYLQTHRDDKARWIGRLLCQESQEPVIPIMLAWLKDSDAQVRKAGAFNLCWCPSAAAVSNLLDAIGSEGVPEVKAQMLEALAQTGDERGLDTLLAAASEAYPPEIEAQIARGLGRIRDPKALASLADMVTREAGITDENSQPKGSKASSASWYLLSDAANAFGCISHTYAAHAPDSFETSSAINLAQLRQEIASIEQWRTSQPSRP